MGNEVFIGIVAAVGVLLVSTLLIGAFLMARDTNRRAGRWGVNLSPLTCPECGESVPLVRTPKNRRQMLWGGHTCGKCGCEFDKWGREVPTEGGR